jgi:hypothetical protein
MKKYFDFEIEYEEEIDNNSILKIGSKVKLTDETCSQMNDYWFDVFEIKDIIETPVDFPYVLNCERCGKDWVQYFKEEEIETI